MEQSRILLGFVRDALQDADADYRWLDSGQRLACTHVGTGTKLRILSSNAKRAMGLARFSLIFADEPGSWEARGGELMWHALRQAIGKRPGQRLILIGTRSPADEGGWWPSLIDGGSGPGVHVTELAAAPDDPWDSYLTIRRANPLIHVSRPLRQAVLRERDAARRDPIQRRAFQAYRLNMRVDAHNEHLIEADDWDTVERREVAAREGRPILGVDAGGARAWSAATAVYENGRVEAWALVGGIPDLRERERQDAAPRGLYTMLADRGLLVVDAERRVPRLELLFDKIISSGAIPEAVVCDRFRLGEVSDAIAGRFPVIQRVTRWSDSTEDIGGLRRLVADGPLSVAEASRPLLRVALREAAVESDRSGNVRPVKRRGDRSRDDVAIALTLAAGVLHRRLRRPQAPRWRSAGVL